MKLHYNNGSMGVTPIPSICIILGAYMNAYA